MDAVLCIDKVVSEICGNDLCIEILASAQYVALRRSRLHIFFDHFELRLEVEVHAKIVDYFLKSVFDRLKFSLKFFTLCGFFVAHEQHVGHLDVVIKAFSGC